MTKRMSWLAITLAAVIALVSGASRLTPAQPASSGMRPGGEVPGNEAAADAGKSKDDDVLSRDSVWHDPEIPALGNPRGDVLLVEYFDYQCPVCKQLHPVLSRVVRADGNVRLVSKGWPIFGGASIYAARIVLAAKYQGKYAQAHEALFAAKVPLSETVIRDLLTKAGVDPDRAVRDLVANREAIDGTLARNRLQAAAFGFLGTPAFIVGTFRVNGGLDVAGFQQVISAARAAQAKQ
jgi:protein-disulfide isomerase